MTTTSKGSGDDACAEESTVSVVASSPSQEESDEELGSEPSSQATKEVVGELPSGSGEHDDDDDDEDEDGSAACPNVPMKDNADEPSTNEAAASPFSPPPPPRRPRKRGRALPTPSTARTSSSRKPQQRSKEFSDASDFSDDHYYIDEDEAEAFLSTSSNLAYSWDALELGHKLGSPALNRYMARFNEKSPQQQLTAQQTLQIVNSLQLRTIMPPEFSALHCIIQRNPLENQPFLHGSRDEDHDEDAAPDDDIHSHNRLPFKTLARLYETMCEQDVDDGSFNRREVQYLSAGACLERLLQFENTACALRKREEEVLKQANELQVLDNAQVSAMLGYHAPDSK